MTGIEKYGRIKEMMGLLAGPYGDKLRAEIPEIEKNLYDIGRWLVRSPRILSAP